MYVILQLRRTRIVYLDIVRISKWSSYFFCAFALFIVSITQVTFSVLDNVQAMIFQEYKSIILVRYTNPSIVQIYVISLHQLEFGLLGLNCSLRIFFNLLLKLESLVVMV